MDGITVVVAAQCGIAVFSPGWAAMKVSRMGRECRGVSAPPITTSACSRPCAWDLPGFGLATSIQLKQQHKQQVKCE